MKARIRLERAPAPARPFPHSLEYERALLGGLLQNPRELAAVAAGLRPEDFYRPAHARLFALLLEMDERGEPIDSITVPERVARPGNPDQFGGIAYVVELPDHTPATANLLYYARVVADFARRRRALRRLDELDGALRTAAAVEDVLEPRVAAAVALLDGEPVAALRALGLSRPELEDLFRAVAPPRERAVAAK